MALPPPEKLKNKILIKDKLMRKKGESMSTLQRGASLNMDPTDESSKKTFSDGTDSPLTTVQGMYVCVYVH